MQKSLFSRKFILALLLVIFGAVAFLMGKITINDFNALITPVVAIYFASNVVAGFNNKKNREIKDSIVSEVPQALK